MDANTRDVLIATIPVLGGVLVGVLVAKITADRTMAIERAKWRRELYATFLHASDELRDAVHSAVDGTEIDSDWASNVPIAQKALAEIQILSPKRAKHAGPLWDAIGDLLKGVLRFDAATQGAGGAVVPIDRSNYKKLDAAVVAARQAFVDAASKELS